MVCAHFNPAGKRPQCDRNRIECWPSPFCPGPCWRAGPPALATTADQVVDDETLQAFVEDARAEIAAITDVNQGAMLRDALLTEGRWKSGDVFLIMFLPSGEPLIHGAGRASEGKNLLGVEDDRGKRVVEELFAAAAGGGGLVKYHDGGDRAAYAVDYTSGTTGR